VGSTDARRRKRDRPEGVIHGFQVILYKVEPRLCVLARNLLSKDDCRAALADEVLPGRPEVPLVSKPIAFACRAERLARTGSSPDWAVVGPSGLAEGVSPDADTGKEMALGVVGELVGRDIFDRALVNVARANVACCNKVSKPLSCIGVDLVVVVGHVKEKSYKISSVQKKSPEGLFKWHRVVS
jgi:hypothetical protein